VITLGCNIHDNMIGYIIVTAAPWFGRSDARGTWEAHELPAGKFRVRVWHPLLNEPQQLGTQRPPSTVMAHRSSALRSRCAPPHCPDVRAHGITDAAGRWA
jgi:hypothetical protein